MSDQIIETEATEAEFLETCTNGDLSSVMRLIRNNKKLNVNSSNKNGDTAMHLAAANGHVDIGRYLQSKGAVLDVRNNNGDMPWHLAAKYGHWLFIAFCMEKNVDLNARNGVGESALHMAARYGHAELVEALVLQQVDINAQDSRGWTPLHVACHRRHVHIAIMLLHLGCKPDLVDAAEESPLHVACRENLQTVVQLMCSYGCDVEQENNAGMTPLLLAVRYSSAELIRCLMLAGADVNAYTEDGVSASDIAMANGRTAIAELLDKLSSTLTRDRLNASIRQLTQTTRPLDCVRVVVIGSSGVGKTELIESLKCGFVRSLFRRGSAALLSAVTRGGSGKSDVSDDRGAGALTRSSRTSPDGGAWTSVVKPHSSKGSDKRSDKVQRISLKRPPQNLNYTRGIEIEQANIAAAGDVSFWEFSGFEPYYVTYNTMFIGDPNAVYIVIVSRLDSAAERRRQVIFWLNFIRSRTTPVEPIGFGGCKLWAPRVLLVATNSSDDDVKDVPGNEKAGENEDNKLIESLTKEFDTDLIIEPHLFSVDCNNASSSEMNVLRRAIGVVKRFVCEYLPAEVGLLQPVLAVLPDWCRVLASFPVVTWSSFVEYVRSRVNLLATEEHLRELVQQLVVVGEAVIIKTNDCELVVLDPQWLGTDIIGRLLAYDTIFLSPQTGLISISSLQSIFPRAPTADVIRLLCALELAVPCVRTYPAAGGSHDPNAGLLGLTPSMQGISTAPDAELAITCLDRSDGPPSDAYLTPNWWMTLDKSALEKTVVGGFQLRPEYPDQLIHMFPRAVCILLRALLAANGGFVQNRVQNSSGDSGGGSQFDNGDALSEASAGVDRCSKTGASSRGYELTQWSRGVCIVRDDTLNSIVKLADDAQTLSVVCWGPANERANLFFLQETLCDLLYNALEKICPAVYIERSPLSVRHLRSTDGTIPHAYRPREILLAQLAGTSTIQAATVDQPEQLVDLIAFGDAEIFSRLQPGLDHPVYALPLNARYRLAALLDPPHPRGRDVTALTAALGQSESASKNRPESTSTDQPGEADSPLSPTDAALTAWAQEQGYATPNDTRPPTVRTLHGKLMGLDRPDVVEALLSSTPLYSYPSRRQASASTAAAVAGVE